MTGKDWSVMVWTSSLGSGAWEKLRGCGGRGKVVRGSLRPPGGCLKPRVREGSEAAFGLSRCPCLVTASARPWEWEREACWPRAKTTPNPGHGRTLSPLPPSGSVATAGYRLDLFLTPHFSARQFTHFYYNENCMSLLHMKSPCHLP